MVAHQPLVLRDLVRFQTGQPRRGQGADDYLLMAAGKTARRKTFPNVPGGDTERQVGGPGSSTRQVAVRVGLAPQAPPTLP